IGILGLVAACFVTLKHIRQTQLITARHANAPIKPEPPTPDLSIITHARQGNYCADVETFGYQDSILKGTQVRIHKADDGEVIWERRTEDTFRLGDIRWSNN